MAYRGTDTGILSYEELLGKINEGLREQANKPNIYGYKPHDKQYLFHQCTKHTVLYIGGNRSGKTTGGAVESIYRLIGRHPYKKVVPAPVRGRAIAVDFTYGVDAILLPEIAKWMPPSFLINGSWSDSYNKEHRTLTLANKSFLEFKSYDQDLEKFAGTSRHFNWFDEEPPKHIYNECQARLVDVDGDAFITMTPVEGMSWVFTDIYEPGINDNKDIEVIEIEMLDNPYIGKEASERYLQTLDPEERKARERGEFVAMGGRIFKNFTPSVHVIPAGIPPKNWEWYVSVDHGFNNPTAMLWHAVRPDGKKIITFSEHYVREMIVKDHAKVFHTRNAGFGRIPDIVVGDPAMEQRQGVTGLSIRVEYENSGVGMVMGNNDVDSGINRMIQYMQYDEFNKDPVWQITENCTNLIKELRKLRWATYSGRKMAFQKNRQEKVHKKDDHAFDSSRYFFSLMPDLETPTYGIESLPVGNPLGASHPQYPWKEIAGGHQTTEWKTYEGTDMYALEYE